MSDDECECGKKDNPFKGIGYLPTLSDFEAPYKKTLEDTRNMYSKHGGLTSSFNDFIKRGKKQK